jgi:hypothetical protein
VPATHPVSLLAGTQQKLLCVYTSLVAKGSKGILGALCSVWFLCCELLLKEVCSLNHVPAEQNTHISNESKQKKVSSSSPVVVRALPAVPKCDQGQ